MHVVRNGDVFLLQTKIFVSVQILLYYLFPQTSLLQSFLQSVKVLNRLNDRQRNLNWILWQELGIQWRIQTFTNAVYFSPPISDLQIFQINTSLFYLWTLRDYKTFQVITLIDFNVMFHGHPNKMFCFPLPFLSWRWFGRAKKKNKINE